MLRKRVLHIRYLRRKYNGGTHNRSIMGVHAIIVEVVVSQIEMSHFMITVDVASTTLRSSC
jgi:hypothetical protein